MAASTSTRLAAITAAIVGLGLTMSPLPSQAQLSVFCVNCQPYYIQAAQLLAQIVSGIQSQTQTISQTTSNQTRSLERNEDDNHQRTSEAIVSELDAHLAGTGQLVDAAVVELKNALKEHAITMQTAWAQNQFGYGSQEYTVDGITHRRTSQPLTLCGSSSRAEAVGAAIPAREGATRTIADTTEEHSNKTYTSYTEAIDRYEALPPEAYDAGYLLRDENTLSPEEAVAVQEYINTMVDPVPPPLIEEELKDTIAGGEYDRLRKVRNARLDASSEILARAAAMREATVAVEEGFAAKWQSIAPGKALDSVGGKVSPLMVLRTEIDYRYGAKEWTDRLADLTEAGLLRELLLMKALELKMGYEHFIIEQQRASLLAMQSAQDTRDNYSDRITASYAAVQSELTGGGAASP